MRIEQTPSVLDHGRVTAAGARHVHRRPLDGEGGAATTPAGYRSPGDIEPDGIPGCRVAVLRRSVRH
jgi:hypothetical protein